MDEGRGRRRQEGKRRGRRRAGSRHKGDYRSKGLEKGICSYTEKARNCPHNEPGWVESELLEASEITGKDPGLRE